MSGAALTSHVLGLPQINAWFGADDTAKAQTGTIVEGVDKYWGGRKYIYCYAGGSISQYGLVSIIPALSSGAMRWEATATPNTANLGQPVGVAMSGATTGQFIWVCVFGLVPIRSGASVAADTAFGITAAGSVGAIANGKQICNARNILAATTTVAKSNCVANSSSVTLKVPNANGWFIGAYLSGTGIASGATVSSIAPNGTEVTMSAATTAVVSGTVTATYNNSTVFFNVPFINHPFAQGQVA